MPDEDLFEPKVTPIGKCPTCLQPLVFGAQHCPHCGIAVDYEDEDLVRTAVDHILLTQAISAANTLRTMNPAMIIFLGSALLSYLLDYAWWFKLITILPACFILLSVRAWFVRHGNWESNDTEYQEARQQMKICLRNWGLTNLFILLLILFAHKDELPFFR